MQLGVNLAYPAAEGIVGEFSYIVAVFGDFDNAVLVVITIGLAILLPCRPSCV